MHHSSGAEVKGYNTKFFFSNEAPNPQKRVLRSGKKKPHPSQKYLYSLQTRSIFPSPIIEGNQNPISITKGQGGEDPWDALRCRSLSAKEPLIIGLFCQKCSIKIRHPVTLRHPVRYIPYKRALYVLGPGSSKKALKNSPISLTKTAQREMICMPDCLYCIFVGLYRAVSLEFFAVLDGKHASSVLL